MIPLYLVLKDFMGHSNSEIDFSKLSNAIIIIGSEDGSSKKSNAVGKTTIFKAIKYVLFNARASKNKDKLIRDGAKKCYVRFDFSMSDGKVYRIERSRSKTSNDVKFFVKSDKDFEDKTQRRISDTDEDIIRIIGMNLQTFENTLYFKQNDFFNLASTTPEKRKTIIKEMLDLSLWDKYKKEVVSLLNSSDKELAIIKSKILELGNPNDDLSKFDSSLSEIIIKKDNLEDIIVKLKSELKIKNEKFIKSKELLSNKKNIEDKYNESILLQNEAVENHEFILNSISSTEKEIKTIEDKINSNSIDELSKKIGDLINQSLEKPNEEIFDNLKIKLAKCISSIRENKALIKSLNNDLPSDDYCPTCSTELNDNNRESIKNIKVNRIKEIQFGINELEKHKDILEDNINVAEAKISKYKATKEEIASLTRKLNFIIDENKTYKSSLLSKKNALASLFDKEVIAKEKVKQAIDNHNQMKTLKVSIMNEKYIEYLIKLENKIKEYQNNLGVFEKEYSNLVASEAVLRDRIKNRKDDKDKIAKLILSADEIQYKVNIYNSAIFAFSSHGIPFMIVNSVLDGIQEETNKVLDIARNGLQVQFITSKEKTNDDTLDMNFFVDGKEWEWEDLSGGQQCSIALGLKLAMATMSRKRCGADIKLLLLDEVDQALDSESIEAFHNIIKLWSKDMTIMVITHNEQLKSKFSNFVLVNKQANSSSASVI